MSKQDREWQAQNDLSTLKTAEEIRKDQARVAAAKALAKKEMAALKKLSVRKR
jgi:hypothetical protein